MSDLGDGIALAAGPLLVAGQTQDPFLGALGALLHRLPWLIFGLQAGVLADRVDRRQLLIGVDLARGGVLVVLATALLTGDVGIAVVLAALFVLGVAEVFADTTSGTLLPTVVRRADLGTGNARLMTGALVMNEMVGPALGAALFVAGTAWPFVTEAVLLAVSAGLSPTPRLAGTGAAPAVPTTGSTPPPADPGCRAGRSRQLPVRPPHRRPWAPRPRCSCARPRRGGRPPARPGRPATGARCSAPPRRGAGGCGRRAVLGPLCLNCIRVVTLGRASRARRRRGGRWRGCGPRVGT